MSGELERTCDIIGGLLTEASMFFKAGAVITLLVRNPRVPGDADFVMTNDTLPDAIWALQRRHLADIKDARASLAREPGEATPTAQVAGEGVA